MGGRSFAVIRVARSERNFRRLTFRNHNVFAALVIGVCAIALASVPASGQDTTTAPAIPHTQDPDVGLGNYPLVTKEEKLVSCMALWEPATHMTKERWRAVCKRVQTDD